MTRARPTTRSIHYKNVSPQGLAFSCLNFVCFDKCFVPDHVQLISLISWNDHNCGGWSSIKLENPDGTHCETNEKSLSAGDTLEWSLTEGGLKGCSNMVVTQNTTLYIQTSSSNDFCPKYVWVTPVKGLAYKTNEISDWYDKGKTINKKHTLQECKSTRNNLFNSSICVFKHDYPCSDGI